MGILEERRAARLEKKAYDERLKQDHLKAIDEIAAHENSAELIARAISQVDRWESRKMCHRRYIDGWRAILSMPFEQMREAVSGDDDNDVAMRQNTPLGFLVGKYLREKG